LRALGRHACTAFAPRAAEPSHFAPLTRRAAPGARAGAFVGPDGKALPVPEDLPNAHMRLFGGAQYHRAMAEFRGGIGGLACPDISREEIVNACGIDDFHDGVNYTRTACVIAVSKARDTFEPFLHQARARLRRAPARRWSYGRRLRARSCMTWSAAVRNAHAIVHVVLFFAALQPLCGCLHTDADAHEQPHVSMRARAERARRQTRRAARSWATASRTSCGACCRSRCSCCSATRSF